MFAGTKREISNARSPDADPLLDVAQRMYAQLTDGAPKLGYHVKRGLSVRDATTKRLIRSSYAADWRPARDRHHDGSESDRTFNPWVLKQHLLGSYDVALQWPSWTSLIAFDIDRHDVPSERQPVRQRALFAPRGELFDIEAVLAANAARDKVLEDLWRAFDFGKDKQPVILLTPGEGYHVYLPVARSADPDARERTWPAAWLRELVEHKLNQHGLVLKPGRLELFPAGTRLRVPCGRRMALMVPQQPDFADDLQLRMVGAKDRTIRDRRTGETRSRFDRNRLGLATAFCDAIDSARRPLHEWLGQERSPWDRTWGPWGAKPKKIPEQIPGSSAPSQHIEEVLSTPAGTAAREGAGFLVYGKAFNDVIRSLTQEGLVEPGGRHDGALKLTWHWGLRRGLSKNEIRKRLGDWLVLHSHNSTTMDRSPRQFLEGTLREALHYYDRHVVPCLGAARKPRGIDIARAPLGDVDKIVVQAVDPEVQAEVVEILRHLQSCGDANGRVPHPVNLSARILSSLCGERRLLTPVDGVIKRRRKTVIALEELQRIGVLALHTNYSTGRHGRLYTCWYQFGSGALPSSDDADGDELVLATKPIEEGVLQVVSAGRGSPRVRLIRPSLAPRAGPDPWWVRMYERRAFTPAEFFEGTARKLLPGPFRHRWSTGDDSCPACTQRGDP